jgi:hypothetical protein
MRFFDKIKYNFLKLNKKIIIAALIMLFVIIILLLYFFISSKITLCNNDECYFSALSNCNKASYLRQDEKALWSYEIIKNKNDNCLVNVKLVRINLGTIDIEKLEGKSMECSVKKYDKEYPETDMSLCSGLLKEELQDILIRRMHDYLYKNLKEIKEEFNKL